MQWKFCPFCGNISIKQKEPGSKIYKCLRCDWEGIPDEGDMTKINATARNYVPGTKWTPPVKENKEEKEPEKANPTNTIKKEITVKKVPKNKQLLEKLKGKDYGDAEFL